jgi:acyl-CoA dehydrogenase
MLSEFLSDEHRAYREIFQKFLKNEVIPNYEKWEKERQIPRELWKKAGNAGFLAPWVELDWGGSGGDFIHSCILIEEVTKANTPGWFISLHSDVIVPYIYHIGNKEQKQRWLPGLCDGSLISSIAMTEPDAGSDLKAIRTTAVKDGKDYILNGSKTFISNGQIANFCIVVAKTNPKSSKAESSISLFVVEGDDIPGYNKGRNLEKIGLKAQDTSELFFEDCRIPESNLLGKVGRGFFYLMTHLQKERLVLSIASVAAIDMILQMTIKYVKERNVFDQPLSKFQNTQFELAEMATKYEMAKTYVQKLIRMELEGKKYVKEASMAKYYCTDAQVEIANRCLQLFGGYGYMMEYPIARAFVDSRVQPIYAGTNEIMKMIIAKKIGL